MRSSMKRALQCAPAILALAILAPAQPAASQSAPVYDVTEMQTPYGPMGVAYRALAPAERTRGYTHEIAVAHPIWGYGMFIGRYSDDCAGSTGRSASIRRWDGTRGGDAFESRIEEPIFQVLGYDGKNNLLNAILCRRGPVRLTTIKVDQADLTSNLRRYAGQTADAWRMHTITEPTTGRSMRFAAWGTDENRQFTGETSFESTWGREYGAAIQRFQIERGASARDLINFVIGDQSIGRLTRRRDIVQGSAYLLVEAVIVDSEGVSTVARMLVCQNRPALLHLATAEYQGLQEQQIALRFVNGLSVSCS